MKHKIVPVSSQKPQKLEEDSDDSFVSEDSPKRDGMICSIVKNEETGSYYHVAIHYKVLGDKYYLSIKDITKRKQICTRQEIPNEFALYQVPVENLEDPDDIM